eukprot:2659233-Pyramimonas_sp.AAC.1
MISALSRVRASRVMSVCSARSIVQQGRSWSSLHPTVYFQNIAQCDNGYRLFGTTVAVKTQAPPHFLVPMPELSPLMVMPGVSVDL